MELNGREWNLGPLQGLISSSGTVWNGTERNGMKFEPCLRVVIVRRNRTERNERNGMKWGLFRGCYRSAERNGTKWNVGPLQRLSMFGGMERNRTEWNFGPPQGLLLFGVTERDGTKRNGTRFWSRLAMKKQIQETGHRVLIWPAPFKKNDGTCTKSVTIRLLTKRENHNFFRLRWVQIHWTLLIPDSSIN